MGFYLNKEMMDGFMNDYLHKSNIPDSYFLILLGNILLNSGDKAF